MDGKGKPCSLACLGNDPVGSARGKGSLALGAEQVRGVRIEPLQLPQRAEGGPLQGMSSWQSFFHAVDIKEPLGEVDLLPPEMHRFTDPQGVSEHHQDEGVIAMAMARAFSGFLA